MSRKKATPVIAASMLRSGIQWANQRKTRSTKKVTWIRNSIPKREQIRGAQLTRGGGEEAG
jgi:hypothetical protein